MKKYVALFLALTAVCTAQANTGSFAGLSARSEPTQPLPATAEPVVALSCVTTNQTIITSVAGNGQLMVKLNDGKGKELLSLKKNTGEVDYDLSSSGNHYTVTLTIPNGTLTYQVFYGDTGSGVKVLRDGKWVNGADCIDGSVKSDLLLPIAKNTFNH